MEHCDRCRGMAVCAAYLNSDKLKLVLCLDCVRTSDTKVLRRFSGGDAFSEAFDLCREFDHPIRCIVNGAKYKLFPSGRAENLETEKSQ